MSRSCVLCSRLANNNLTGVADVPSSNCCETKLRIGPTVGKVQQLYVDSTGVNYYSNKTVRADGLIGCDSGMVGTVEFTLSFSVDSCNPSRNPLLNVRSDAPWEMDLAVQCCGTCSTAAVSQLEEVDLSNNRMRGPPPFSLAKHKASLRKLNLTYNHLEGDYTRLAEITRRFARADGESMTLTIRPQMPCADGFYADAGVAAQDILPNCMQKPVRLPKALRRRQAANRSS
jgi:hypothetical protein